MVSASLEALAEEYNRDGYVVFDLDIEDFDRVAADIVDGLAPKFDDTHRIENAWRTNQAVRQLATQPQILKTLKHLYGREAFPFQTLNFDRGTQQATHSDTIHFDSTPKGFMGGVWVALEDIDAENGPVHYFPGSQNLPQATLADFGVRALDGRNPYELYRSVYEPGIAGIVADKGLKPKEAHLRKGQALIWSANLLHGGQPILDPSRTRHSQVTHYYFEGCSYHTPLLSDDVKGLYRRYPVDIRTGKNVGGVIDGKPVQVPVAQRMKSLAKNVLQTGTRYRR
jgi:hypothetical protein